MVGHNGLYFTGAQTQVLIGDRVLSEVVQISGSLNVDQIPIYGYASHLFNTVAHGRVMASGTFTINYIFDGYLLSFINQDKTDKKTTESTPFAKPPVIDGVAIKGNLDYYNDAEIIEEPKTIDSLTEYDIARLKNTYWESNTTKNSIRPEFTTPFKIKIRDFKIGTLTNPEDMEDTFEEKILTNVHISQSGTVRSTDGNQIVETYQFYARNLI